MSYFSIDVPGKGSSVNQSIKKKMCENDNYSNTCEKYNNQVNTPTQLYGGKLYDPRSITGLGLKNGNATSNLLYTRDCHPKYKDGKIHKRFAHHTKEHPYFMTPYSYDTTCLLNANEYSKDVSDIIDELDINELDNSKNTTNEKINDYIIVDTMIDDSMKGNFMDSMISFNFMSRINMDVIQDTIESKIYQYTLKNNINSVDSDKKGVIIGRQSYRQLFVIMRSILLQYGDMTISDKQNLIKHIKYLNKLVVDYCVKNILNSMSNYVHYLEKKDAIVVPFEYPTNSQSGKVDISDLSDYRSVNIDPLTYYPGYALDKEFGQNNNKRTSIINYRDEYEYN